jgi:hypothetical protein
MNSSLSPLKSSNDSQSHQHSSSLLSPQLITLQYDRRLPEEDQRNEHKKIQVQYKFAPLALTS